MPLTPEESQRIYEEEAERLRVRRELEATPSTPKNKSGSWLGGCLIVVIAMAVVSASLNTHTTNDYYREAQQSFYGGKPPPPVVYRGSVASARQISHQFVKKRLKSPSTAEFAPESSGDETVHYLDGKYTVKGWVDAPNSFNAKLRSYFVCTVHWLDGQTWVEDDLQIEDVPIPDAKEFLPPPPESQGVNRTSTSPANSKAPAEGNITTNWYDHLGPPKSSEYPLDEAVDEMSTATLRHGMDLRGMSVWELTLLRNAPYARHGLKFSDPKVAAYFYKQNWYHPVTDDKARVEKLLTDIERDNISNAEGYQRSYKVRH